MLLSFFADRFGSGGFLDEKLWLGHTGNLLVVLSFCASLLAFFAYFAAEFSTLKDKETSWRKLARASFITHGLSVIGIFVLLFVMILNHMFEYHYAWRHSSTDLPIQYIVSSFWEGQEGSFLLWQFWLVVLGFIGIKTFKDYENPVMGITALTQVFLGSMVLGIYIFGHKIGSNPFVLLRDEMANAPIFQRPNYLSFIKDGNGLSPLLQNYWMTIHPPVLFCGFASVTIPFAYAIASLLRKDWNGWVKPATIWTLFSVVVLGTGIMMGGKWAYESLSFGGFWAWDPVENMSLVPWLMIVAGLHMLLVYKHTKHSLISTYVFFILAFGFVLYSTFLTRSGILGDTSVHAFTDLGMTGQLLLYMLFFLTLSFTLLTIRVVKKQFPVVQKEEEFLSRELWMFIGALVLFLSGVQMTFTTSIPVWNKILAPLFAATGWKEIAPPVDVIEHYNSIQVWMGILVAMLTGIGQYFAFKTGKVPPVMRWGIYTLIAAVLLSIGVAYATGIEFTGQNKLNLTFISQDWYFTYKFLSGNYILLIASLYALLGNLAYMIIVLKNKVKLSGGSVSHLGFGVFLVGVIISQGEKEVISINRQGINFGKEFTGDEKMENILLLRDSTLAMGDYQVTYTGSETGKHDNFYAVQYKRNKNGSTEQFTLRPTAKMDPKMGMVANPDTKHYFDKDVFTHVSSIPDNSNLDSTYIAQLGVNDTFRTRTAVIVFTAYNPSPILPDSFDTRQKIVVGIDLIAMNRQGQRETAQPVLVIDRGNSNAITTIPSEIAEMGLSFNLERIDPDTKKVLLSVYEVEKPMDFIIMKAIIFPYINLVWLGGILTFLGAFISMVRKIRK